MVDRRSITRLRQLAGDHPVRREPLVSQGFLASTGPQATVATLAVLVTPEQAESLGIAEQGVFLDFQVSRADRPRRCSSMTAAALAGTLDLCTTRPPISFRFLAL